MIFLEKKLKKNNKILKISKQELSTKYKIKEVWTIRDFSSKKT